MISRIIILYTYKKVCNNWMANMANSQINLTDRKQYLSTLTDVNYTRDIVIKYVKIT